MHTAERMHVEQHGTAGNVRRGNGEAMHVRSGNLRARLDRIAVDDRHGYERTQRTGGNMTHTAASANSPSISSLSEASAITFGPFMKLTQGEPSGIRST